GRAVLMGDLNREPDELSALADAGLRPAVAAHTFPIPGPRRQLDHILISDGLRVKDGGVLAIDASDHLPVWAELEI
ncbi:MAG: endonuclease/exonuclease/phosphatase family protein, partial [Actinomycetota bacterium]